MILLTLQAINSYNQKPVDLKLFYMNHDSITMDILCAWLLISLMNHGFLTLKVLNF